MHPTIRYSKSRQSQTLCLLMALASLSLTGTSVLSLTAERAVAVGQIATTVVRKTSAESIVDSTIQQVSQRSGTQQKGAADAVLNEGIKLYRKGTAESLGAAIAKFEEAARLYSAMGDRSGEATTLNNIGSVYSDLGEKQKALSYFNQALPLRKAVGDRSGEATTLNNIRAVNQSLGKQPKR
jgi:tetratricopeptide (TPR) repeat protein